MKVRFDRNTKIITFEDLDEMNANDTMYQTLDVDCALSIGETLWVTFKRPGIEKTYNSVDLQTHDVLLTQFADAGIVSMYFPEEIISNAGTWVFQLLIRTYSGGTIAQEIASDEATFFIKDGLSFDGENAPVNKHTVASLYEGAKQAVRDAQAIVDNANAITTFNPVVEKTETLEAGEEVEVDVKMTTGADGKSRDLKFSFGIPQGYSAYEVWAQQPANEGKDENAFLESLKGKSAYEVWKDIYGGSEGDFFNALKGDPGDKGAGFSIARSYPSVAAMNAGHATDDVPLGGFVIIESNVDDPDNAKLYYKGEHAYVYLTDMSGSQGIQGVGIASLQAKESTDDGGINEWTATMTDSTDAHPHKYILQVRNGSKGSDGKSVEAVYIENGDLYVKIQDKAKQNIGRVVGEDGNTPEIEIKNGYWFVDNKPTDVKAEGVDGKTPYIQDGYWYVDGVNTGVVAKGEDGESPYIGDNGNWYVGDEDTFVSATGVDEDAVKEIINKGGHDFESPVKIIVGDEIETTYTATGIDVWHKNTSTESILTFPEKGGTLATLEDLEGFTPSNPSAPTETLTYVTYNELKALRANKQLIPGQFYRITDYECTTTQEGTSSAGHQFDIIVQAIAPDRLSEDARADFSASDNYFAKNYGIGVDVYHKERYDAEEDNVIGYADFGEDRFIEAGYTGDGTPALYKTNVFDEEFGDIPDYDDEFVYIGQGVPLYYEGKDGPFDMWEKNEKDSNPGIIVYTNIVVEATADGPKFTDAVNTTVKKILGNCTAWELKYCLDNDTDRFAWADEENGKGVIYWMRDEYYNEAPYDFKNITFDMSTIHGENEHINEFSRYNLHAIDIGSYKFFTFSMLLKYEKTFAVNDMTVYDGDNYHGEKFQSKGNIVRAYFNDNGTQELNFNIIIVLGDLLLDAVNVEFGRWTLGNIVARFARSVIIGNNCSCNLFGSVANSSFGDSCSDNVVLNGGSYIAFDMSCSSNFILEGDQISFGKACGDNVFRVPVRHIRFGNTCQYNEFSLPSGIEYVGDPISIVYFEDVCCANKINAFAVLIHFEQYVSEIIITETIGTVKNVRVCEGVRPSTITPPTDFQGSIVYKPVSYEYILSTEVD